MVKEKSVGIAVLLSFFLPGSAVYCGRVGRGVLIIILAIICFLASAFLIIPYFIIWIYGMYDAYKMAEAPNKEPVKIMKYKNLYRRIKNMMKEDKEFLIALYIYLNQNKKITTK